MCGIAGFLSLNAEPPDPGRLARMVATLRHRGPDDHGECVSGAAALGAARLSIIDVAGGHQPISIDDGAITVAQNGEIYNYVELKRELERQGRRFKTTCDTEVIAHLYAVDGVDASKRMRGMFAVSIWDARHERLVLARDRAGKKPLYYTRRDGALVFGSETKAILAALEANEASGDPLPVHVHTGFGDPDLFLPHARPGYLKPLVERFRATSFVLLHCCPSVREAGWLAHVYADVYFDVSLTIPHVSRPAVALAEALELAPVSKLLYASDAARTPELYLLAALLLDLQVDVNGLIPVVRPRDRVLLLDLVKQPQLVQLQDRIVPEALVISIPLVEEHFAAHHHVPRVVVPNELQPTQRELPPLLHFQRNLDVALLRRLVDELRDEIDLGLDVTVLSVIVFDSFVDIL